MGCRKALLIMGLFCMLKRSISSCAKGYKTGRHDGCEDVNECETHEQSCGNYTHCFNTEGSFYCQCYDGFRNRNRAINFTALTGQCHDINECDKKEICGPNAYCTNLMGTYTCTCQPGCTNLSSSNVNCTENCSMQKKGNIDNNERTAKACETEENSKIDFVYKVKIEGFEDASSTDIYKMRIEEVIKEGSFDQGARGKLRVFLSYPHCRESLELGTGKAYLIMGTSRDMHRDDENGGYQYVLGQRTWIEYWPTDAECQTNDKYRPTCVGMDELRYTHKFFGCTVV